MRMQIGNTFYKRSSKRSFDILMHRKFSSASDKRITSVKARHASSVVKKWVAPRSVSVSFCGFYAADIVPEVPTLPNLHWN